MATPAPFSSDPPVPPGALPLALTSFIGREGEVAELVRLLATTRLVTLTGAGGVGKTRLALAVAATVRADFPDGTGFVDLAALTDPALVPQVAARALGVTEQPGRGLVETLAAWLANKHLLLVLDNCEQLIEACAHLVGMVLTMCPRLLVLATSREALGIGGEVTWRVPSLAVPDERHQPPVEEVVQYSAVRLFVERATQVQPGFTLTEATAPAVARICTRLDGIPLAIELAAARVPLLTVEQIAARLDDAIRLLTGGSRTAAPRQQTLRATLEWSHDLLTEPERVLFRRLAVFAGGWTLEAAEAVCAGESLAPTSILDLLGRLVAKSLVQVEHGEETRYRLLETVRQYARERLEEADEGRAVGSRHARWYLALAEWAKPQTLTGQQQASWRRLEAEQENLRAALAWCLEHDPTTGLRLAACYWGMMIYRNQFTEGRYWLESFLARASEPSAERAAALGSLGRLAREHGELPLARARYEDALALRRELGDQRWLAWGLGELGGTLLLLGDLRQARVLLEEALPLIRPVGIPRDIGAIMGWLGWEAETAGDYDRAWSLLEESTAILRQVGDQVMICRNLWLLGRVALWRGDAARAQALLEEGLALVRAGGIPRWISLLTWQLGQVAHHQGDLAGAIDRYTASLNVARETGFRREIAWALAGLGLAAGHLDEVVEARGRLEESLTLFTTIGYTQGRAVALHGLGLAAWGQGEAVEAVARLQESLRLRQQMGERLGIAECLEGLAAVAVGQGHHGRAARLLGAAEAMREAIGAPLPPVERLDHVGAVRAAREALGERSFASAWAAGGALPLEQAVAEALGDEPASVAATGPTSITPLDPAGLTRREVEVLRLLAGGATDREIAGGLSISIKTVNKHVASILGKTGSANRTAAGAFAHQHGLG